jgi:hypothetical protein
MENSNQVKELVRKVWRVQSKAVGGDASVDKAYEAIQKKKPISDLLGSAEGGSSFDLHSTWQILYEAVDLTVNVLALYGVWKQRNETPPSKKEILQLIDEAKIDHAYSSAVLDKLDTLIEQIIKQ